MPLFSAANRDKTVSAQDYHQSLGDNERCRLINGRWHTGIRPNDAVHQWHLEEWLQAQRKLSMPEDQKWRPTSAYPTTTRFGAKVVTHVSPGRTAKAHQNRQTLAAGARKLGLSFAFRLMKLTDDDLVSVPKLVNILNTIGSEDKYGGNVARMLPEPRATAPNKDVHPSQIDSSMQIALRDIVTHFRSAGPNAHLFIPIRTTKDGKSPLLPHCCAVSHDSFSYIFVTYITGEVEHLLHVQFHYWVWEGDVNDLDDTRGHIEPGCISGQELMKYGFWHPSHSSLTGYNSLTAFFYSGDLLKGYLFHTNRLGEQHAYVPLPFPEAAT